MEGKKCGAGYRNRQLPHSTHFDLSNTGVTNNINTGCIPFWCASALILYVLAYWHGLLARLNGKEPSLMLAITPVFFLLWPVKMCAVRMSNLGRGEKIEDDRCVRKRTCMQNDRKKVSVCVWDRVTERKREGKMHRMTDFIGLELIEGTALSECGSVDMHV